MTTLKDRIVGTMMEIVGGVMGEAGKESARRRDGHDKLPDSAKQSPSMIQASFRPAPRSSRIFSPLGVSS
jgi:hypothetical protein